MSVQEYIEKHDLTKRIEEALNAAVKAKADEPLAFVVRATRRDARRADGIGRAGARGARRRARGDARERGRTRAGGWFGGAKNAGAKGTGRARAGGGARRGGGSLRSREAIGCLDTRGFGARGGRARGEREGRERRRDWGSGAEDSGAKTRRAATRCDEKTID